MVTIEKAWFVAPSVAAADDAVAMERRRGWLERRRDYGSGVLVELWRRPGAAKFVSSARTLP
jgi:hypothetical protein